MTEPNNNNNGNNNGNNIEPEQTPPRVKWHNNPAIMAPLFTAVGAIVVAAITFLGPVILNKISPPTPKEVRARHCLVYEGEQTKRYKVNKKCLRTQDVNNPNVGYAFIKKKVQGVEITQRVETLVCNERGDVLISWYQGDTSNLIGEVWIDNKQLMAKRIKDKKKNIQTPFKFPSTELHARTPRKRTRKWTPHKKRVCMTFHGDNIVKVDKYYNIINRKSVCIFVEQDMITGKVVRRGRVNCNKSLNITQCISNDPYLSRIICGRDVKVKYGEKTRRGAYIALFRVSGRCTFMTVIFGDDNIPVVRERHNNISCTGYIKWCKTGIRPD